MKFSTHPGYSNPPSIWQINKHWWLKLAHHVPDKNKWIGENNIDM